MGHLIALEGNGDNKSAATTHLQGELVTLFEQEIEPLASKFALSTVLSSPTMVWKPLVLLMGDHSAGKSSFINNLLGISLQPEGQEKSQHGFTVITGFRPDDGGDSLSMGATLEEKHGDSLINDELYPFGNLGSLGQAFSKQFALKKSHLPRLANLALIDTPPMVTSEGTLGTDNEELRIQALMALANLADVLVVFFDPHRPWNFSATYERLKRGMPEATLSKKSIFVLNRIDTCTHLQDFLEVYGSLYWHLAQTLTQSEVPRLFLTYSRAHSLQEAVGKKSFLNELSNDQHALEQAIFAAPILRLHHMAAFMAKQSHHLKLFLTAVVDFHQKNSRFLWKWVSLAFLSSAGAAAGGWYVAHQAKLISSGAGEASLNSGLIAGGAGLLLFLLLLLLINKVAKRYAQRRWLESLEDQEEEALQHPVAERPEWLAIAKPLYQYLGEFSQHKKSLKQLKKELKQVERAGQTLNEELNPAIEDLL